MRLIFISSAQYPNGGASTNRHLAYAKGLVELGHSVEFILLRSQSWQEQEIIYQGIKLVSVAFRTNVHPLKLGRIKLFWKAISNAEKLIISINKVDKISIITLLDTNIAVLIPFLRIGHKIGVKIFHERTEYPFVVKNSSIWGRIELYIYLKYILKKFDGLYVINNALRKYFSQWVNKSVSIYIINMMVDPSRFEFIKRKNTDVYKTIIYCGKYEGDKDGVPILLNAFSIIANEFPKMQLNIIGTLTSEENRRKLLYQIKMLGLERNVILSGPLSRDEVPEVICSADILALARPNNKQAEGGFPTKLGEYLATGNPVVVTNVGEIGLFLKDGINAFISEPDNAEEFANKLREAILSDNAEKIGNEGKRLVYNEFNYLTQAKKLEEAYVASMQN